MKQTLAVAALLGATSAGRIPVHKREMTLDMYNRTTETATLKFLGGEAGTGEKVKVTNFMDAQYFIDVSIGTPS